jgi:RNA polymerase sigma-70 factor (ECF subfamily)
MVEDNRANLDRLISRAAGGDRAAFEVLLLRFYDRLKRYIEKTAGGSIARAVSAEDILQETFTEAFRYLGRFEVRGHHEFYSWLKTIAHNRLMNAVKARNAKKRGADRINTATSILGRVACREGTPSLILRRKEALEAVTWGLSELEPMKRRVLEMRYGEQMEISAIAAKVGRNEGAVRMLISRGIKELRAIVEKRGEFTFSV